MLVDPSGTGKTPLALKFAMAAVRRGEHAALFSFDETFQTWVVRGRASIRALEKPSTTDI